MSSRQIAILGAGMAGMAAANTLQDQDCVIYEARPRSGGHASSFQVGAYTFDEGPHLSFTKNERVRQFMAASADGSFLSHPMHATAVYQGCVLQHPVECNLHGLPQDLISQCINSFMETHKTPPIDGANYGEWCNRWLGEVITDTFTRSYIRRYYGLELEQLTTDWVSSRITAPTIDDLLAGATGNGKVSVSEFRYPRNGGFQSYTSLLTSRSQIECNRNFAELDPHKKRMVFSDGHVAHYQHLISSLALPELISRIPSAPQNVRDAAENLYCTSHLLVSVGVKRPHLSDAYWTYFYDHDIAFTRAHFPSKYSPNSAPTGCSSVQVELVHFIRKPLPAKESIVELSIDGLLRCGILKDRTEIDAVDVRNIPYANVVFDFHREPNLKVVHRYLESIGIDWCGRYGDWGNHWTDQAMLSGERAANKVRARMGLPAAEFA